MKHKKYAHHEFKLDKRDLIEALPVLLQNNSHDHDIYFVTFTFHNSVKKLPYICFQIFFDKLRSKIDQFVLSHPDVLKVRPRLILFPEVSNEPVQYRMFANPHFHGFLLIHKDTREKFERKAISRTMSKMTSCGIKQVIHLCDRIINPFSAKYKSMTAAETYSSQRTSLSVYSHEMYHIKDVSEFFATSYYSSKCYLSRDFAYDDIIVSSKMIPQS